MLKLTCKKCGHVWVPRTDTPLSCPQCKSRRYSQPKRTKKTKGV